MTRLKLTSSQVIALGFAAFILFGGFLLTLPIMHANGQWLNYRDALFTATSAVCVTGLIVVDTGTFYTTLGQCTIMFLIQVGGLGIVTVAALLLIGLGKMLPFSHRNLLTDNFSQTASGGIVALLLKVVKLTFLFEGIGALLLTLTWTKELGLGKAAYFGVFHAVSAFCNAGFDLFGGYRSLTGYVNSIPVNLVISSLIIFGGLGFPVILDAAACIRRKKKRLELHSKIVILTTIGLIVFGALMFYYLERDGVLTGLSTSGKALASYFQSVTPRTAGFNTVDMSRLRTDTILLTVFLMFVGASPISTGGGIKTSTFALIATGTWSVVRGDTEVRLGDRSISKDLVLRAVSLTFLALILVFVVTVVIRGFEPIAYERILFEVTSAFGTVGLTTGITPHLAGVSRWLLIITMYIGRIGPLTLMLAIAERRHQSNLHLPEGKVYIG